MPYAIDFCTLLGIKEKAATCFRRLSHGLCPCFPQAALECQVLNFGDAVIPVDGNSSGWPIIHCAGHPPGFMLVAAVVSVSLPAAATTLADPFAEMLPTGERSAPMLTNSGVCQS